MWNSKAMPIILGSPPTGGAEVLAGLSASRTIVTEQHRQLRIGLAYGLGAYLSWGFVPIYFKLLQHVPAIVVVAHRVAWSLLLLAAIIAWQRRWGEMNAALRSKRMLLMLGCTTLLIATNWITFIWAVSHERVMQASLGYYINPLFSVLLGMLLLRERMRRWQFVSLALATAGVVNLVLTGGEFPWIALILAVSFGLYGLLRKIAPVAPLVGLMVETGLLMPIALAVIFMGINGQGAAMALNIPTHVLLIFAGVITTFPLLWFAAAAQRLRLSTMGFLQYIAPTCQFLLAVLLYREPFTTPHAITFIFIWTALAIFTLDSVQAYRRQKSLPSPMELSAGA